MTQTWMTPDEFPPLLNGEVHLWRLALVASSLVPLRAMLSDDENQRADRFLFERHREHYIVGRAKSRQLLARYLSCPPESIRFTYENLGKPRFDPQTETSDLRFNFSNSNDRGLLAVTRGSEVGIDLERIRPMHDMMGLAGRYYCDEETQKLMNLAERDRPTAFFRCWTRKEAYLKAIGKGLTFPLNKVEVTLLPEEECSIHVIDGNKHEAAIWRLAHLDPYPEYVGAVAIRDRSVTLRSFDADVL